MESRESKVKVEENSVKVEEDHREIRGRVKGYQREIRG